jgi:RPA family protein
MRAPSVVRMRIVDPIGSFSVYLIQKSPDVCAPNGTPDAKSVAMTTTETIRFIVFSFSL